MSGDSTATLRFLPWMRRGLARAATQTATDGLPAAGTGTIAISVTVDGTSVPRQVRLRGPGDVVGLSGAQILREDPPAGTQDFEPDYFPTVELVTPDLPWMFTPAAPGDDKLIPWLVLVVVEEREGVELASAGAGPLPVLSIEDPADARSELPDLAEAWAWAHVQAATVVDADRPAGDAYAEEPEAFLARLVCPRRLVEDTRYLACLVPAFEAGRRAGLGIDVDLDDVRLAWSTEDATVELPVYHSWSFRTGPDGDFEALVRRLEPRELDAGVHDLDVGRPGGDRLPEVPGTLVSFEGALVSPAVTPRTWDAAHREDFRAEMRALLNEALEADGSAEPADYDPLVHDPVVAPPAYGALPAGVDRVPPDAEGRVLVAPWLEPAWLADVNLDPARRATAGLGAEVVRRDQEALMASAWAQAASLRDINRLLTWTRLAAEVGRALKTNKIDGLDDGALLQVAGPALGRVRASGHRTVAGRLAETSVPDGLVSGAFRRVARRGGPVGRGLGPAATRTVAAAAVTQRFVADLAGALSYAAYVRPLGAQLADASIIAEIPGVDEEALTPRTHARAAVRRAPAGRSARAALAATVARAPTYAVGTPSSVLAADGRLPERALTAVPVRDPGALFDGAVDLADLAGVARSGLDPTATLAARLAARVTAPESAWGGAALPASMGADPEFSDPLYARLRRLDPEYLLPGVGEIPDDTVGLTEANAAFVEAFLLGANHELAREFLWREYPVDLTGTWLRTFWDAIAEGVEDIAPVADWDGGALGTHQTGPGADGTLVLVVKGALLRRYPDTAIYAVKARWNADETAREEEDGAGAERRDPVFTGALTRDTVFLGFSLTKADALGDVDEAGAPVPGGDAGWFFVFEEAPAGPRFGLDAAASEHAGTTPTYWKDASWGHLVDDIGQLDGLTHATAAGRLAGEERWYDDGTFEETWGAHAAAMARITYQRPVRMLVHASAMLP